MNPYEYLEEHPEMWRHWSHALYCQSPEWYPKFRPGNRVVMTNPGPYRGTEVGTTGTVIKDERFCIDNGNIYVTVRWDNGKEWTYWQGCLEYARI